MSAGIQVIQNGVVFNAAGIAHPAPITLVPGELAYLSFIGAPVPVLYAWSTTTTLGAPVIVSSSSSPGPTIVIGSGWVGSIVLRDENLNTYVIDVVTASVAAVASSNTVIYAVTYGVKADGRKVTDGVIAVNSNVLTSATASFTQGDVGKRVLLRVPTNASPGTAALVSGNVLINGSGTPAYLTNIPNVSGVPLNGGGIYVDGEYFAIVLVLNDTQIQVQTAPTHSISGVTLYRETQVATTIASVTDATHAVLAVTGASLPVAGTSLLATIASDDTTAMTAAITAAAAQAAAELRLPAGLIGLTDNLYFTGVSYFTITGQGYDKSVLTDMRLCSFETPVAGRLIDNYGLLSFKACTGVHLQGFSVDGSVPIFGYPHTTGGIVNNSGGRIGIFFRNCISCSLLRCGSVGYGARDEHIYADSNLGTANDWRVEDCELLQTNGNSINGGGLGTGIYIRGNRCNSGYTCISLTCNDALVLNNDIFQITGFTQGNGAGMVLLETKAAGRIIFAGNTLRDADSHLYSTAAVTVRGQASDTSSFVCLRGNSYDNLTGYFYNGNSAVIRITQMKGTVVVDDETFDQITAGATGGTFIEVDHANTERVFIGGGCVLRGRAGSNMTRGIVVDSTVPAGKVTVSDRIQYGESVTTRIDVGAVTAGILTSGNQLLNAATGGTVVLDNGLDSVVQTGNGAETFTVPDARFFAGGVKRIRITNSPLQLGTTTIQSAGGRTISGLASVTLTGPGWIELEGDSSNWQITASSSRFAALVAMGGGAAPTLGTIGGSGPATAAQNTWMRFADSTGVAVWVPCWK